MPRRYRRNFRRSNNRDRNLVWTRNGSSVVIPSSAATVLITPSAQLETQLAANVPNYTVERVILDLQLTVPASTSPGRSYEAFLGLAILEDDAIAGGVVPEPYVDRTDWIWLAGPRVFADHTVPASYASPGVPHSASHIQVDIRNKRRIKQMGQSLVLVGWHDNGLSANPTMYYNYSALFNVR